ncbi:MAG TPA: hypothetical protein VG755_36540, partial [Nannocystaceae bacterium]|nr:hypothetical protein [Nannocystaceae bacterium]
DTLEAIASARRRGRLAVSIVAGVLALGIGASVWIGREREHSSRADALAGEAAVEHARAEQALEDLADREQAVLLAEAKILLERDPTTAVAKLAQLDPASTQWGTVARVLAADARDRGVARRVIPLPPGREARRWWRDDWVVTADPTRDGEMLLDPIHGTVMPLGAAREHVLADGRILLGTLHGLWLVEPGAKQSRRLHEAAFYSDLTTRLVVARNGEHAALIGEVGDAAVVHVYSFASGTVRTERFENGTDILALADDGRRMVVYEAGQLFVHGGAREITLVRDTTVGTRAVSSDFRTIAWGMRDATGHDVLVVADTDGKELRRMTVEGLGRNDVELSPDGQRLALRRRGGGLELIDIADGSMRRLASAEIDRVRFTADGAYLLAADERRAIHVWRPADGGLRTIHCGLEPMDFALDVRADRLRVLGRDQVREYQGVVPEARRAIPNDAATTIAADPAARTIVVADRDGAAVIVYRDELAPRRVPIPDGVDTVAVSPDGERFATAGGPRLSLFERDGDLIAEVDDPDAPMRLEFDPSGMRLAWIGHSGTVVVWRGGTREPQLYEPGRLGVYALAFEPGTDRIAVVGWDHIGPLFYMLDPFRGVLGVIPMKVPDDTQPRAIALSSRKQLAYAAVGKGVFVADAKGGAPRRLGGRDVADASLWFSPDGGQLAAIGGRSGATIWDVESGASYHPALAGVQPRAGFGTIGADGSFTIVGDQLVTRAVLGLGGDADDVRTWVAGATDLHVDPGPLAFLAE